MSTIRIRAARALSMFPSRWKDVIEWMDARV